MPQQADEPLDESMAQPQIAELLQEDGTKTNVFAQVALAHLALHSYGLLSVMHASAAQDCVLVIKGFAKLISKFSKAAYERYPPKRSASWDAEVHTIEQFANLRSHDVYANAPLTAAIALLGIYRWMLRDASELLNIEGRFAGALHAYCAGKKVEAATVEPVPIFEQATELFNERLFPQGTPPLDETQHVWSWFMGYIDEPTDPGKSGPRVPRTPVNRFDFIDKTILGMACPEGTRAKTHIHDFHVGRTTTEQIKDFESLLEMSYGKLTTHSIGKSLVSCTNLYNLWIGVDMFTIVFSSQVDDCEYMIQLLQRKS